MRGIGIGLALSMTAAAWSCRAQDACGPAIARAEAAYRIPDAFLLAIGAVESGRPEDGRRLPWPWTVNAAGEGHFYASKAEAVAAVRGFQATGIRSIDVGCLQVNLQQHPEAFASLEQAFDPAANADYAARFLVSLRAETGSWPHAAAAYHSRTHALGAAYQDRVLEAWAEPGAAPAAMPAPEAMRPAPPAASPLPIFAGHAAVTRFATAARPSGRAEGGGAVRDLASYRAFPVRLTRRAG